MTRSAKAEFVALVAFMTSFVALSIDAMLPALPMIAADLGAVHENDRQLVVSMLFLGMAAAQLVYGPVSDATGRRPAIIAGFVIFLCGCVLSLFAAGFETMLLGRFLQGVGAAGPRTVSIAMVRDRYHGPAMARIMSLAMGLFILVPIIAPALGQAIMIFAPWRAIFVLFLVLAVAALAWFALRQDETLEPSRRRPLSPRALGAAFLEVVRNRCTFGYTLAGGLVFGAFVGYLNSSQQIFQDTYRIGPWFTLAFAALSVCVGIAAFVNARLVMTWGMRKLSDAALAATVAAAILFAAIAWWHGGTPPLWSFMVYMGLTFFCVGILFGNYNALAMEPMGHIAGLASAAIGSMTTFLSMAGGTLIGRAYDGTVLPLALGFCVLGLGAVAATRWANGSRT